MRQRIRSMLLALALALSLGAVPVLADQTPQPESSAADPAETEQAQSEEGEAAPAEDAEETEEAAPCGLSRRTGSGDCWRGHGDCAGSGGNGEL